MKAFCVALGCALTAAEVPAQMADTRIRETPVSAVALEDSQSADIAPRIFKSGVDLVALNVVVTKANDEFVPGLSVEDFAVYEDGVQQDVAFFAAAGVPLDLALLLDTSASMTDKMATLQQAAVGFATTLRPDDRVSVLDIKDAVRIVHPLDSNFAGAISAIGATAARGGTALYNGLYIALKEMAKLAHTNGEVRRQAIVVFSDGDDTASLLKFDDVLELAKQSGISIYTITLRTMFAADRASAPPSRYFSQAQFSMKALAQETGGRFFFPSHIKELAAVYGSIAEELSNQYALAYTSKNPRRDGAYRRLVVRVVTNPGVTVRTRAGYLSPRTGEAARLP